MESPPQRHFCVVLGRENSSDGLAYYSFCVDRKKCGELGEFGCCKGGNGAQLITTTPKSANVFEPQTPTLSLPYKTFYRQKNWKVPIKTDQQLIFIQ